MSHDEASDLLGAYALDAVEGAELAELEEHLETCPRCRAELDGLREVAAAMGNSVEVPPEGLWSRIALRLPEGREDDEPPPMPRLTSEARTPFRRRPTAPPAGTAPWWPRWAPWRWRRPRWPSCSASGWYAPTTRSPTSRRHRPRSRPPCGRPGTRSSSSTSGSPRAEVARVVVVPSGQGYLVSSKLPALGDDRTYQLWAIEAGQPISLGLLGRSPRHAAFTMAGSTRPSHLSITAEPKGGSVAPTGPIIATGTV